MSTYKMPYFNGDWSTVPKIDVVIPYKNSTSDIHSFAQVAYNDEALLIHMSTDEENIRREELGVLGSPCHDSCLEFFFSPMADDLRYFNIEFNINGCMFLGYGTSIKDLIRLLPNEHIVIDPEIRKLDKGWEIFYSIPYSFINLFFKDFKAEKGKSIRANCYKCADMAEPKNYYSWCPITSEKLSFHRPEDFGTMIFD